MKPIILIGMMGCGKTTIGQQLSQQLKVSWCDTDQLVEQHTHQTITQLFQTKGEADFRKQEHLALKEALKTSTIISTGGGIVTNPLNGPELQSGTVIYLKADVDTLVSRLDVTNRPLLQSKDLMTTLQNLLAERAHLYEQAATFTIDTTTLTIEEIVSRILTVL